VNISKKICFVVPCYNEENRLPVSKYISFIKQFPDTVICFVNDGSTDNTHSLLLQINSGNENQVHIISYTDNVGKAEAVRKGVQYCNSRLNHSHIAYLDADLSTPLKELVRLSEYINEDIEFCFGSRIMLIGAKIERKFSRHFVGRIIATFISNVLEIKVYDTQCGCKIFTKELSVHLFEEPFISRWLFDVELFARKINLYGKDHALKKMLEIPLKEWINKSDSKVKIQYFFLLWIDLFLINYKYKKRYQRKFPKH
jgi:glycosyltransferase involved in cell wall biosynthesis